MLRFGGALIGVVALSVAGAGSFATAKPGKAKASDTAVVKMVQDGKDLFFEYPETVEPGQVLKIKNTTDPRKVGPHTFSLVQRSTLPKSEDDIKACEKKLKGICGAVVKWHQVDLQTGDIGRNPVEAGKKGWDEQGNLKHRGDSWASEAEGSSFKQKVTAEAGKTIHFFCAVHPFMQGKIRVEDATG